MSNVLAREKQIAILSALVEGNSVRASARMLDVDKKSILALLVRIGEGCEKLHDVTMRALPCVRIESDEIWGYIGKHQRFVRQSDSTDMGDVWTWTALCADSKAIVSYRVGKRGLEDAIPFISDLKSRLTRRIQLSTDGLRAYKDAVELAWGGDVDYAQVIKEYGSESERTTTAAKYSPPKVKSVEKVAVYGNPDMDLASTSYVERQNLTIRMHIRRMTRLTNAFSKKLPNHKAAIALHFAHYNLCRVHQTLRVTPGMEVGVTDHVWTIGELMDAALATEAT